MIRKALLWIRAKTVTRNEVESGFKDGTSMVQIYVVPPQGNIKK